MTGASDGGVFRWREAEAALSGDFRKEAVDAPAVSEEPMIGDLDRRPAYRAHLVKVLTGRAAAAS